MSVSQSRLVLLVGKCRPLFARQSNVVAPVVLEGRRHLTTKPQYKKPYPYETKSFGYFRALFDYTSARINENSRILLVEGLPCVGKSEFAKGLADTFKLKYIPPVSDVDLFHVDGYDVRQLDDVLAAYSSDKLRFHDLDWFYADLSPEEKLYFSGTQMNYLKQKYYKYMEALRHVLHTGQGVVLENSVWSDACYALNMADHGYFTKNGIRWLMEYHLHATSRLWKPHLVIHLDAPSSLVVQRMKERYPQYAESPLMRESYFDGLRDKITNIYMPYMANHCDTLYYDVTQMEDFDLLAMDIESMDLISKRFAEGVKFVDWRWEKEESWSMYRVYVSDMKKINLALRYRNPIHCPEFLMTGEEFRLLRDVVMTIPDLGCHMKFFFDSNGTWMGNRGELMETPTQLIKDNPHYKTLNIGEKATQVTAN